MSDEIAGGQVNPDTRVIIAGWARQDQQLVSSMHVREVASTIAEDRPVNRGTEAGRVRSREWWGQPGMHRNLNVTESACPSTDFSRALLRSRWANKEGRLGYQKSYGHDLPRQCGSHAGTAGSF